MLKVIGRFVPTGLPDYRQPFNVVTMKPSEYLSPAWEGKKQDGEEYHVAEKAWRFEPVWYGEGLPPVGTECEWHDKNTNKWFKVSVVYSSEWVTVIREDKEVDAVELAVDNYGDEQRRQFRPIRSEADKKREAAINAILDDMRTIPCDLDLRDEVAVIYDAIAAGKIPGVKLDV